MKSIYIFIACLSIFLANVVSAATERRVAIDIGSGGTKVAIADVDAEKHQIVEMVYNASFPVAYQASLDRSVDGRFDGETIEMAIKTFKEIKQLADQYKVAKIHAVATSAFRKSNNSKELIEKVKQEADIDIEVIPQREEGELAFFSALANGQVDAREAIVWDIGTGSLQMTTLNGDGKLTVYMGEQMGSVAFKSYVIDAIQEKDVDKDHTPNPISAMDLKAADSYARSFGRKAYPLIKEKIKNQAPIIGIGRLFYNSIRPVAAKDGAITRQGLRSFIRASLNKSDEELNNPFADVDVTNCILTLAIMKSLHINEVYPIETTSTQGILVYPTYWLN